MTKIAKITKIEKKDIFINKNKIKKIIKIKKNKFK